MKFAHTLLISVISLKYMRGGFPQQSMAFVCIHRGWWGALSRGRNDNNTSRPVRMTPIPIHTPKAR